jgi:hypothetical protein
MGSSKNMDSIHRKMMSESLFMGNYSTATAAWLKGANAL